MQISAVMRAAPLSLCVVGRKRDYVLKTLDVAFRRQARSTLETEFGSLVLNWDHAPERLLYYCFYNVLRYYDRSELGRYIRKIASPGAVFVDVGANLGVYALLARRAGMGTVVVEPEPNHASFLMRNRPVFGKVLPYALSNDTGELPLYYDADNPAGTSLCNALGYRPGASVPVRTYSDLAREGHFGPAASIRLIKIDVEGFEVEAVEGMREEFGNASFRPDIWCEVRGDAAGRAPGSFRRVRWLLERHGYHARTNLSAKELTDGVVYDLLFTLN